VVGFTTRCTGYANMLLNGFKKINLESVKYVNHKDANQYSKMYEEIKDIRFPYLMFIDCWGNKI
jgi:hypothetical protein